jgi:hypothetical protein
MSWNTYRDERPERTRALSAYYTAHKEMAAVPFDAFRARVKRGMAMDEALTTPKLKEWGGTKAVVLAAIIATPGVSRRELSRHVGKGGSLTTALDRLLAAGVIREDREEYVDPWRYTRTRRRYYHVAKPLAPVASVDEAAVALERTWKPQPYVNPIRARALGLPVAETERTREVREALRYRPGRAA